MSLYVTLTTPLLGQQFHGPTNNDSPENCFLLEQLIPTVRINPCAWFQRCIPGTRTPSAWNSAIFPLIYTHVLVQFLSFSRAIRGGRNRSFRILNHRRLAQPLQKSHSPLRGKTFRMIDAVEKWYTALLYTKIAALVCMPESRSRTSAAL